MLSTNKNKSNNADAKVVEDFGREWEVFNHSGILSNDLESIFNDYFSIFPLEKLHKNSVGFDMGCGTGRWAKLIAAKVKCLHCIDASELALKQAKINLSDFPNCEFECASVQDSSLKSHSQDFGYCLGVLHHIPDTLEGLRACADKLKPGAPFLLYLYYRFDNKPLWYRFVWRLTDFARLIICKLPFPLKFFVSQIIAFFIYYPLSRIALLLEKMMLDVSNVPLADYRKKSIYVLRTDALDRFGTRLEKRFTKKEIREMMIEAGFKNISFRQDSPYWVAIGTKS